MKNVLESGIDMVLWLQSFSPTFDLMFKVFSLSGNELFYLLFLPLIIWSISFRLGVRLMFLVLLSTYVNSFAKLLFDQPRPFNYDPRVKEIVSASGGGFPSGHTQNALVFWSYLAFNFKSKRLWFFAILMAIFVPLSRVYLGVHFPIDILGGYALGIIILLLFIKLEAPLTDFVKRQTFNKQLLLSLLLPAICLIILPPDDATGILICGVLAGCSLGFVFEEKWINFKVAKSYRRKLLCYLIGTILLFVLYIGLKRLFLGLEPSMVFLFSRYFIIGIYFTFLAPWILKKLKLIDG
ncbi:MAG: membrane-associated phospholipid phosphatase [Enterobacterales bacterium]|jgi:membrane-associated phospholipid phosphatase